MHREEQSGLRGADGTGTHAPILKRLEPGGTLPGRSCLSGNHRQSRHCTPWGLGQPAALP